MRRMTSGLSGCRGISRRGFGFGLRDFLVLLEWVVRCLLAEREGSGSGVYGGYDMGTRGRGWVGCMYVINYLEIRGVRQTI